MKQVFMKKNIIKSIINSKGINCTFGVVSAFTSLNFGSGKIIKK